jgi:hypothetical protein
MKIGLIAADGKRFPNLALMKLAAHHKATGDSVEWVSYFERYDRVYMSKVFTFTPDATTSILSGEVVKGGTGYGLYGELFCDGAEPDYAIYESCPWYSPHTAYGFLTRGCPRSCPWCVVPQKEGNIRPYRDVEAVLQGRKVAILMDNNVLACGHGLQQIEKIAKIGCKVDFNQGLDARLIAGNPEVAKLLARVKWISMLRLSCDSPAMLGVVESAAALLRSAGLKPYRIFCYALLKDLRESYERINFLKSLDIMPFAQPYRDFTTRQAVPQWQADMARWCNDKAIFKSCDFKGYRPRKGFCCKEYFMD